MIFKHEQHTLYGTYYVPWGNRSDGIQNAVYLHIVFYQICLPVYTELISKERLSVTNDYCCPFRQWLACPCMFGVCLLGSTLCQYQVSFSAVSAPYILTWSACKNSGGLNYSVGILVKDPTAQLWKDIVVVHRELVSFHSVHSLCLGWVWHRVYD